MYARVTTFRFQPGAVEDATTIAREVLVPGLGAQAECRGAYFATHAIEDKAVAFSLWDSEQAAGAPATVRTSAQEQLTRLMSYLVGPPTTEVFEVRAHL